jgi:creatinine amidohydrolase
MQLHLSTWPEVEAYLARSKAILIPIGSTSGQVER